MPNLPNLDHIQIVGRWVSWVPSANFGPMRPTREGFDADIARVPCEVEALRALVDAALEGAPE